MFSLTVVIAGFLLCILVNVQCLETILFFLQENEKTKDVIIEQRFHRAIIGAKGEKIRETRDKYPEVQISFPDAGKKSDIVNLRGPREDVDSVYTLLKKLNAELVGDNLLILLFSIIFQT